MITQLTAKRGAQPALDAHRAPLTLYWVFWLFLIAGVAGDLVEIVFWLGTRGELTSRSSLIYGQFSIVWGAGAVLLTLVFHRMDSRSTPRIFLAGTLLGGVYEYVCSLLQEKLFGACFWDYRHLPFNLNGRVNLVFCLFWGLAALARTAVPDLPLHGSTQMTVHSLDGVKLCADLGMARVVLGRELSGEDVRHICRQECERYNTSWSCPPAVGTVEECRNRCEAYEQAVVFTTLAEVTDAADMAETLETRKEHEEIVHAVCRDLREAGLEVLALSSDSCAVCETCAWPDAPCRHAERMLPCIESYGILVTSAAEKLSMDFFYDGRTVVWYGFVFIRQGE